MFFIVGYAAAIIIFTDGNMFSHAMMFKGHWIGISFGIPNDLT